VSIEALDYAIDFARSHRAELLIVHMIEPITHTRFIPDVAEILERQRADEAQKLVQLEKRIRRRFTRFRSEIHFGAAHEQIPEIAKKDGADLIIMATHGHTGLHHLLVGSVAERVVRLASCPVLTLKPRKCGSESESVLRPSGNLFRPNAKEPVRRSEAMNTRRTLSISLGVFCPVVLSIVLVRSASAQSNQLFVYPLKNQSQQQQDKDRYECHTWAVQQTGFDPSKMYPNNPNSLDPQPYQPTQRHILKGGARGAALGAVGGAIAGDAGRGAAAGAAMGGLVGGFRRRDERQQQAGQQQASAASAAASQRQAYSRAMAACLEGRAYSVK
jgi:nucleotide-binding universal stress UspA family protein